MSDARLLRHLVFDASESDDGILTLEASASTRGPAHEAVMAEVRRVLDWAELAFAGRHGPLDEGHAWDHALLVQDEAGGWRTVTLTLAATAEFAEAFAGAFIRDED